MALPRVIVTGASGFVGRHLLEQLKGDHRIVGIARRSQRRAGVPEDPNITWLEADIGERPQVEAAFRTIAETGGADYVVHLAAYYDFTGLDHPEYTRTNVHGLRNVLDLCAGMPLRRFIFASSLAACRFPSGGRALTESSPPDGEHVYARTKRLGEAMLNEYQQAFPSAVVRLAALFSDWCEYPPLFVQLNTWLSSLWNAQVVAGRGLTAMPYLHVHDAVAFLRRVLERESDLTPGEVLIASSDGAVSHREVFGTATLAYHGKRREPRYVPKALCRGGIRVLDALGRVTGQRPFERPWMAHYIDREMRVDSSVTRRLLGWSPRPRLELLRRVPFLVENMKTDPHEWIARNQAAMKAVWISDYLKIYWLLQQHEPEILTAFHAALVGPDHQERFPNYQGLAAAEHDWNHRLIVRQLFNAVRTGDKSVFTSYCRDLAARRFEEGFEAEEFCGAVELLNLICMRILRRDPASEGMRQQILDYLTMTLRFGCDQAQETFEELSMRGSMRDPEKRGDTWRNAPESTSSLPDAGISSEPSG
jgi:nucleoside-diphosphate-sugar epimerase